MWAHGLQETWTAVASLQYTLQAATTLLQRDHFSWKLHFNSNQSKSMIRCNSSTSLNSLSSKTSKSWTDCLDLSADRNALRRKSLSGLMDSRLSTSQLFPCVKRAFSSAMLELSESALISLYSTMSSLTYLMICQIVVQTLLSENAIQSDCRLKRAFWMIH